jgi:dihydropteroate synthase
MILDGADILDVGGESTRPKSVPVPADEEINRVIPVIEAISERFDTPVSIDTTKSVVAQTAVQAGAEIINDISGLRFDERIAAIAAESGAGLVVMHSRGEFASMHSQEPVEDILSELETSLRLSIEKAVSSGVCNEAIVLDIGIGFGKSFDQNLELIARLDKIASKFDGFPVLVGASRKSFIGKVLGDASPGERLSGSLAAAAIAVWNGASIIRVHDVAPTVDALKLALALRNRRI